MTLDEVGYSLKNFKNSRELFRAGADAFEGKTGPSPLAFLANSCYSARLGIREMSEIAGKEMILRERLGFNDQSTGLGDVFL